MIRTMIKIDEAACNGCGLCVNACHEGAIALVNGKAKLLRDDYCDGLGNCLPVCPTGAIAFEQREAAAYDAAAVQAVAAAKKQPETLPCGCPGTQAKTLEREPCPVTPCEEAAVQTGGKPSELRQWPVQIKLVPVNAPYLNGAHLLVAADCTAYAYGAFHKEFMRNKVTLIGCPKLDEGDYSEKLTALLRENDIRSITVVRMEVPCCGGIEAAVKNALRDSGKLIAWRVAVISTDGRILEEN